MYRRPQMHTIPRHSLSFVVVSNTNSQDASSWPLLALKTTWKILFTKTKRNQKKKGGCICWPFHMCKYRHSHKYPHTHLKSEVSKLHPEFLCSFKPWLLMAARAGKTSVQQAFPLWHQDRTISNWRCLCPSVWPKEVTYKTLPSPVQLDCGGHVELFSQLYWYTFKHLHVPIILKPH